MTFAARVKRRGSFVVASPIRGTETRTASEPPQIVAIRARRKSAGVTHDGSPTFRTEGHGIEAGGEPVKDGEFCE
jgi:hypothetical protein